MSAQIGYRGGANRRCDCYRPDTLGDGITSNVGTHKLVAGVMHGETPSTQTFISDGSVTELANSLSERHQILLVYKSNLNPVQTLWRVN